MTLPQVYILISGVARKHASSDQKAHRRGELIASRAARCSTEVASAATGRNGINDKVRSRRSQVQMDPVQGGHGRISGGQERLHCGALSTCSRSAGSAQAVATTTMEQGGRGLWDYGNGGYVHGNGCGGKGLCAGAHHGSVGMAAGLMEARAGRICRRSGLEPSKKKKTIRTLRCAIS